MALKLEIGIDVKGTAKQDLAGIEQGIQKVQQAASSSVAPIAKAADAVDELTDGKERLRRAADLSTDALVKEMIAVTREDAAREIAKQHTIEHTSATADYTRVLASATAATGLSTVQLGLMTAGLGAAAVASTAMAALIVKSTRHYFEHAEATRDSREALDDLADGWDKFQMLIGGTVLGDNFSIVRPVQALNAALLLTGSVISARIQETRAWASLLATIPGVGGALGAVDWLFSKPDATPGDVNLSYERPRDPKTGMTQDQFTAEARITALHAELKRQADAAKDAQRALEKHNTEVQRFWQNVNPGWTGLTSMVGTSVGLPEWAASGGIGPWMSGLAPGARTGMYGSENSGNPFAADNAIPLPLWVQAMGRSSGLDIYQYWDQHGGGPEERPGFWARGGSFGHGANIANQFGQGGFAGWSGAALAGIGAGMDFWNETGSGSTASRALNGMMTGASIGSIVPGIGTAIGAGVGALVGAIRGWMAPTEYELRTRQLGEDRRSAESLLQAPGLERAWNFVGGNVPFDFDFLKTQAHHDPTAVGGYIDDMLAKHDRLEGAMERYGISWEQLGEKAKQSKIDELADEMILDFDVLTQAGADVDFTIGKMSTSINDFVAKALRTGSEVPEAMRPMLQRMTDLGLLTDDAGEKMEDLEGITFSQSFTSGVRDIVSALDRIALLLGDEIPGAIRNLPPRVDIDVNYRYPGAPSPDYLPGPPEMPGTRPELESAAMMAPAFASFASFAYRGVSMAAAAPAMTVDRREFAAKVPIVVELNGQVLLESVARTLLAG